MGADGPHALLIFGTHRFRTDVGRTQEGPFFFQRFDDRAEARLEPRLLVAIASLHCLDPTAQHLDFRVALEHFEAGVDQVDAVEDGLELGRFVHHVHRGRNLAAVVQQAGDLELVPILVGHDEVLERAFGALVGSFCQHHGQRGHALAVASRIGGLVVDRRVDEVDERFEEMLELVDEKPRRQDDGSLRRERLGQALVRCGKRNDVPRVRVPGVDQLQHPDDFVLVILHGDGQKGSRPVPGLLVEEARARKVEALRCIGITDVHGRLAQRCIRDDHRLVGPSCFVEQRNRVEVDWPPGRAAKRQAERVGSYDLETELPLLHAIERAGVRLRDGLRRQDDRLEQPVDVLLAGECDPDPVQLLGTIEEVEGCAEIHPHPRVSLRLSRAPVT